MSNVGFYRGKKKRLRKSPGSKEKLLIFQIFTICPFYESYTAKLQHQQGKYRDGEKKRSMTKVA